MGQSQTDLADMMNDHINSLLSRSLMMNPGKGTLVSYTPGGIPNLDVTLAGRIVKPVTMVELLGENWASINEAFASKVRNAK